jgi:succinate dehydrogenase / fumarate reductase flavoprotein subunit
MQGLADGYFIAPYTISDYLASSKFVSANLENKEFKEAENSVTASINKLLSVDGKKTVDEFHREFGKIMWDYVGMARTKSGLKKALEMLPAVREQFWKEVKITGNAHDINTELEKAQRVADFMELGELMALDALNREESCGGHFREEYQTEEGEALRNDKKYSYVAAWEYGGPKKKAALHKENLVFEYVHPSQRSYK